MLLGGDRNPKDTGKPGPPRAFAISGGWYKLQQVLIENFWRLFRSLLGATRR
jgi:hypothetical protein